MSTMYNDSQVKGVVQVDANGSPLADYVSSATFTPAAASHTAGDVNGGAQQFSSVGVAGTSIMVLSASVRIDGATAEATSWALYLFTVTPPSALADDAAFLLPSVDRASFVARIDIGTAVDIGDTQFVKTNMINEPIDRKSVV